MTSKLAMFGTKYPQCRTQRAAITSEKCESDSRISHKSLCISMNVIPHLLSNVLQNIVPLQNLALADPEGLGSDESIFPSPFTEATEQCGIRLIIITTLFYSR